MDLVCGLSLIIGGIRIIDQCLGYVCGLSYQLYTTMKIYIAFQQLKLGGLKSQPLTRA